MTDEYIEKYYELGKDDVYLYDVNLKRSVENVRIFKGGIYFRNRGHYSRNERAIFVPKSQILSVNGKEIESNMNRSSYYNHVTCHDKEMTVFSNKLWLTDRDDELAIKLFIEYEMNKCREFEAKAEECKMFATVLEEYYFNNPELYRMSNKTIKDVMYK